MLPFELTAENVVKACDEAGIILYRGAVTWEYPRQCARAAIVRLAWNEDFYYGMPSMYSLRAQEITGLTDDQLHEIELGFEDGDDLTHYNKIGREIARLALGK